MDDRDVSRLLRLVDIATDEEAWLEGLDDDEDSIKEFERRMRRAEVAGRGAHLLLLLRQDEELWEAWERY